MLNAAKLSIVVVFAMTGHAWIQVLVGDSPSYGTLSVADLVASFGVFWGSACAVVCAIVAMFLKPIWAKVLGFLAIYPIFAVWLFIQSVVSGLTDFHI